VAALLSYGAYLPRYRVSLGEIQKFYGRPGRPRAKMLATPALDEDPITMAFEAAGEALAGQPSPGAVIVATQAPPVGLRKTSATLADALGLSDATALDVGANPSGLLDAFAIGARMAEADDRPVLVVASDHLVSYAERVADMLSAGGATAFLIGPSGGFATLGVRTRARREVFDVWRLGTEPEARYRLEVLFDAYGTTAAEALGALERESGRATGDYAAVAASQPHPQTLRALGRAGVTQEQLAATSFVGEIGNIGAASAGLALALALDAVGAGDAVALFGYGGGEGIAQAIEVTGAPPAIDAASRIAGSEIPLGTYYRWTRGRQAEPH
jgi:hydroxymethylglutaryl-CoA synthase